MAKEFLFYGKNEHELKKMSVEEFAELLPSRERRTLKRGLSDTQKNLLKKIKNNSRNLKTHAREMVIIPEMIGKTIKVHNGKEFVAVIITKEMAGHRLGEFALTRKLVGHNSPGIGATRSSSSMSVK